MAGQRRSRKVGQGMTPFFDLDVFTRPDDGAANPSQRSRNRPVSQMPEQETVATPTPINYSIRGVFRSGNEERPRTVQAVGMSTRLESDVATFVTYLRTEGFQFAEGRGTLIELLAVSADNGIDISVSDEKT